MKFVDPDGNDPIIVGALIGMAINLISNADKIHNFWDGFGFAVTGFVTGAFNGYLASISPLQLTTNLGAIKIGLSLAPQISFGSDQLGVGFSADATASWKLLRAGLSIGASIYSSTIGTGEWSAEARASWRFGFGSDKYNVSVGQNSFSSGETSQKLNIAEIGLGKFKAAYENDEPFGDGEDRFRTAGVRLSIGKHFNAGLNLFTGDPRDPATGRRPRTATNPTYNYSGADKYRAGIFYLGWDKYRVGANSEAIREVTQNALHRQMGVPIFKVLNNTWKPYFYYGTSNQFTTW